MLIQAEFGIIQNLQTSPMPQSSFLPWTFLAASYSKAALIFMAFGMILLSDCCMLYRLVHNVEVLGFSIKQYHNFGCHLLHRSGVPVVLRTSESTGPCVILQSSVDANTSPDMDQYNIISLVSYSQVPILRTKYINFTTHIFWIVNFNLMFSPYFQFFM